MPKKARKDRLLIHELWALTSSTTVLDPAQRCLYDLPTDVVEILHECIAYTQIPDHTEIKIGTLLSIIRQSGLPRAVFEP
jgi:hypothetical protein